MEDAIPPPRKRGGILAGNLMKRSEMIQFIKEELIEIIEADKYKSPAHKDFYDMKAAGLLDMIEGFGMLPPERWRKKDWNERGITYSQWLQETSKVNEWDETENE